MRIKTSGSSFIVDIQLTEKINETCWLYCYHKAKAKQSRNGAAGRSLCNHN